MNNIHGKTVALFMACCRIGAMESGCDERMVRNLELFGECLGLMFQIRDDLLDFTSDVLTIGKSAHKDFQEGIYTMPILCAMLGFQKLSLKINTIGDDETRKAYREALKTYFAGHIDEMCDDCHAEPPFISALRRPRDLCRLADGPLIEVDPNDSHLDETESAFACPFF